MKYKKQLSSLAFGYHSLTVFRKIFPVWFEKVKQSYIELCSDLFIFIAHPRNSFDPFLCILFLFLYLGTRAETHPLRCTYLEHRDWRGAGFGADWGNSTQPSQHKDASQMSGRVAPQVPADRSAEKDLPQNHSAKVRKC